MTLVCFHVIFFLQYFKLIFGSQNNWKESTTFPYISWPVGVAPIGTISHPGGPFVTKDDPTLAQDIPESPWFTFGLHLDVVHPMSLEKRKMKCMYFLCSTT